MRKIVNIIFGCLIVCASVIILSHAHLVTGGTTGIALGVAYVSGIPFSIALLLVSVPFYLLSILRMGWEFTLATFFAAALLSVMSAFNSYLPEFIMPDFIGAVLGGGLLGLGLSVLFLNRSSLGGVNVLVLYLQKKWGWNPGKVTFITDSVIVLFGVWSIGPVKGMYSILSVLILSSVIHYFKNRIALANQVQ